MKINIFDTNIINFETQKQLYSTEIKNLINEIIKITRQIEKNYSLFKKSNSNEKKKIKENTFELLNLLHAHFSKIETLLREIQHFAVKNNKRLQKEKIPKFKDYIEMTEKKFEKFKKLDENEKRMIIWIELFINKLRYLRDVIIRDLDKNRENEEKIKLINKFYAQISVVRNVFNGDAFMLGAPYRKIKIKGKNNEK